MTYALSAQPDTLRLRADILSRVRRYFEEHAVLEVETPALSTAGVSDLHLDSVAARVESLGPCYLHTSPEYAMKRLLSAGLGDLYQICRVFRDGEVGRWHQPEFTLLEWYRVGWDETALMDEVAQLLGIVLGERVRRRVDLTYEQAFRQRLGLDPHGDLTGLAEELASLGIDVPAALDRNALLDLAFGAAVAPSFESGVLTFVYDFPASQAALARIKQRTPPVAARFEVFVDGVELANGFAELTDAFEQRRRFEAELAERRRRGRPVPPLDESFLAALTRGLPPCAGVALGLDRLIALAAGVADVASVMAFAHAPTTRPDG